MYIYIYIYIYIHIYMNKKHETTIKSLQECMLTFLVRHLFKTHRKKGMASVTNRGHCILFLDMHEYLQKYTRRYTKDLMSNSF